MIIYLDESGDLGFDFKDKHPSRYFVITVLVCQDDSIDKRLQNAVSRTIKNKLGNKASELKGAKTELAIKNYFLTQLNKSGLHDLEIHTVVVDKRKLAKNDTDNKDRLYIQISVLLLRKLDYSTQQTVTLIVDKCKNKYEMSIFDTYLKQQIALHQNIILHIRHHESSKNKGLQAVDLFCWGVFRKYEQQDESWYQQFKEMILYEQTY